MVNTLVKTFAILTMFAGHFASAETFGERQLVQVLSDRPKMQGILDPSDPLYVWFVTQFDQGVYGVRVHWDNREPIGGFPSTMLPPSENTPSLIRVSSSETISGRDQWCLLAFELENLLNTPHFVELNAKAISEEIEREAFLVENMKLEHLAVIRTQDRLKAHKAFSMPDRSSRFHGQFLEMSADFLVYRDFLARHQGPHYFDHFRQIFDQLRRENKLIQPVLKKTLPGAPSDPPESRQ